MERKLTGQDWRLAGEASRDESDVLPMLALRSRGEPHVDMARVDAILDLPFNEFMEAVSPGLVETDDYDSDGKLRAISHTNGKGYDLTLEDGTVVSVRLATGRDLALIASRKNAELAALCSGLSQDEFDALSLEDAMRISRHVYPLAERQ